MLCNMHSYNMFLHIIIQVLFYALMLLCNITTLIIGCMYVCYNIIVYLLLNFLFFKVEIFLLLSRVSLIAFPSSNSMFLYSYT